MPLSIKDLVGLFLEGDLMAYKQATSLDDQTIRALHQSIGDYILLHNRANRINDIKEAIEKGQVQTAAEFLTMKSSIDYEKDPVALMVFEYALNLTLKDHQVHGIRQMIEPVEGELLRFKSVLIQRIQGGGKSLVFGHIMALLKADGYHLSIHVPATSQYTSIVYEMGRRSGHVFGQRERTFIFDDNPLKFTPRYLSWILNMLKETIVTKGYVTTTSASLRAFKGQIFKDAPRNPPFT